MAEYRHRDHDVIGEVEKAEALHQEDVDSHHDELTEEEKRIANKLRRKIDMRIMPLVIMVYLMNYIDRFVDTIRVCMYYAYRLLQEQLRCCQTSRAGPRLAFGGRSVPSWTFHPLRRIHPHAGTFQPSSQLRRQAVLVPRFLHHRVGFSKRLHVASQELRRHRCLSFYTRIGRSTLLRRSAFLSVQVVYEVS